MTDTLGDQDQRFIQNFLQLIASNIIELNCKIELTQIENPNSNDKPFPSAVTLNLTKLKKGG